MGGSPPPPIPLPQERKGKGGGGGGDPGIAFHYMIILPFLFSMFTDSDCGDLWECHRSFWSHHRCPPHLQGQDGGQVLEDYFQYAVAALLYSFPSIFRTTYNTVHLKKCFNMLNFMLLSVCQCVKKFNVLRNREFFSSSLVVFRVQLLYTAFILLI